MNVKYQLKKQIALLIVPLMMVLTFGFVHTDAFAKEHMIQNEILQEEPSIVVTDCDYMSEFIYQQGGLLAVEDYGVMTMSLEEETNLGDTEGAKSALLGAMENMEEEIDLSDYHVSAQEITSVVSSVFNENPSLFYATPQTISYDENTELVQNVIVTYDTARASIYEEALQEAYNEAITDPLGMNELQKARALHDWIVQHVSYDHSLSRYDAYDAIVDRSAVCQGYALAYAALLQKAGIEFDYCRSTAMNHMWNYVKIDGNWYHVDTTWDDPSWGKNSADRTGYVRHTFFLNSDQKIQQAASGSSDTHHSWAATKTCSSTAYDNAWWQEEVSAIFVIDGKEYYLKLTSQSYKIQLVCRTGNKETVLYTKNAKWYKWNSNSYYYTAYSALSYYKGRLYFNDPTNLYVVCPGDTTPYVIHELPSSNGYIFGALVCDNGETYDSSKYAYMVELVSKNPDEFGKPIYMGLTGEAIEDAKITAEPAELPYGYTTPSVLTASVYKKYTGTPTYQWYQLIRDSSGVATAKAISGATKSTYTIPTGLSEGLHTYRVKISMDGITLPADITIKVGEVSGQIVNKSYATSYTYDGNAIPKPASPAIWTNAGKMTMEWYRGNEKLNYTPYEPGTYRLHITAEETEYVTAASGDITVTINKRPLIIQPKNATITYGDSLTSANRDPFTYNGLLDGHFILEMMYSHSEDVTDAAKITISYATVVDSFNYQDVTDYYDLQFVEGTVKIIPREITVKADDQTIYKGQELISTKVSVVEGSLPSGFDVIEAKLEGSTKEVTTSGVIQIRELKIKSWGNAGSPLSNYVDATSNYIIKTQTGKLTIKEGGFGEDPLYRIYGKTRYDTSFKIAEALRQLQGVDKFSTIIIASGKNFPDALAGSYLASVKSAPIVMSSGKNNNAILEYVKNYLKPGGTVYILGGESAVPKELYYSIVNSLNVMVRRLSGATRYETNLKILAEAGVDKQDLIVCTGRGFADSLSASATGLPIFLVGKELTKTQKEFLSCLNNNKLYIVGGEGAVSAEIEDELYAYGNVTRISGATRYETSIAVANTFFENPTAAVLAYGKNFPDGLCGGPLAYVRTVPLILTADGKEADAANYAQENEIRHGAVLGGTSVISNKTTKTIIPASKIVEW